MSIQEAIKSGKPFRRKSWPEDGIWAIVEDPESDMLAVMETDRFASVDISIQDILADDWEIKPYTLISW